MSGWPAICLIPLALVLMNPRSVAAQPGGRPDVRDDVVWTAIPIRSAQQAAMGMRGGEGGQCLHGIDRCFADDRFIYLAVDVVGVWKSTDGGSTWAPCRNAGLYCLGTSSIAVHPKDPDRVVVYIDALWEKERQPEEGLYHSVDGGETWARTLAVANEDPRRGYRHLIDFTPDGQRIYFASYRNGFYRSDNGGLTFHGTEALKEIAPYEVRTDPRRRDTVWVAAEEGLFVSRNAGGDFTRIDSLAPGPVTSISPDPVKPDRIYAVSQGEGLFRSEDGGHTFAKISSGDAELDRSARHLFHSRIDPRRMILAAERKLRVSFDAGVTWREPRIMWGRSYVQQGGWGFHEGFVWGTRSINDVVGALSCGIYASRDGGLTWNDSMAGYTGFHHGWSDGAVSFAQDNPDRFAFFCYDYAFNITTDGGHTFRNGRLKEQVRSWWGMYVGDMSPDWSREPLVIAAAGKYWDQALVRSEDGGRTWTAIPDTDGSYFFIRFHPADSRIIYADNLRSDDGGRTFRQLERAIYAFAPGRPDTVYGYGEGKVWRSDDRGETWRALPPPPRAAGEKNGRRDIEVDPSNPEIVWVMTPPDCAVYDGQRWRLVAASRWTPARAHPFVSRMAIDPDRPERIVIGLDAHGAGYLFLSDDGGRTWSDITGNLPRLGTSQSLNIQPGTGRIFVGAGFGTWTCRVPIR